MPLQRADGGQIIRAAQKDEFYTDYLKNLVDYSAQNILGPYWWFKWKRELDLASDLTYYILTTLSGYQTLGEEYVNIIQVNRQRRNIPSLWSRVLLSLLHHLLPYVSNKVLNRMRIITTDALEDEDAPLPWGLCLPHTRTLHLYLSAIDTGLTWAISLHRIIFYFSETFYHFSKRLTAIQYVKFAGPSHPTTKYKVVGALALSNLLLAVTTALYRLWGEKRGQRPDRSSISAGRGGGASAGERKCLLCLERRRDATLTPCGHIYCWSCITTWLQTKSECPLCRQTVDITRLVYLVNYR